MMSVVSLQSDKPQASSVTRPAMNSAEIQQWRQLIQQHCGLHFAEGRLYFLEQRLWEHMQSSGYKSYTGYYNELVQGKNNKKEWLALIEHLLNHESRFFRHTPSFNALTDYVIPKLVEQRRGKPIASVMAWSAGCAFGQETYSLAMVLHNLLGTLGWNLYVLGTDISQDSLNQARLGRYSKEAVDTIPSQYRDTYVREGMAPSDKATHEVVSWLRSLVRFHPLNLCSDDEGFHTGQDIIFCQNVLIYFNRDDKLKVVKRLSDSLKKGGFLFLGPGELTGTHLESLEPIRLPDTLIYRKI